MNRLLILGLALLLCACAAPAKGAGDGHIHDQHGEATSWPPPEQALQAASDAMSALRSMRERQTMHSYRDEQPFLALEGERAFQAPDRRWERVEGRSGVDSVSGETMQFANRFYKRVGDTSTWQKLDWPEPFVWPADEYRFPGATNVSWTGNAIVDGRDARVLTFRHEGSLERRNAGWKFETKLWLDPATNFILQRHTTGSQQAENGQQQRTEITWLYADHNVSLEISEPAAAP